MDLSFGNPVNLYLGKLSMVLVFSWPSPLIVVTKVTVDCEVGTGDWKGNKQLLRTQSEEELELRGFRAQVRGTCCRVLLRGNSTLCTRR